LLVQGLPPDSDYRFKLPFLRGDARAVERAVAHFPCDALNRAGADLALPLATLWTCGDSIALASISLPLRMIARSSRIAKSLPVIEATATAESLGFRASLRGGGTAVRCRGQRTTEADLRWALRAPRLQLDRGPRKTPALVRQASNDCAANKFGRWLPDCNHSADDFIGEQRKNAIIASKLLTCDGSQAVAGSFACARQRDRVPDCVP
jgi:hypothetical protein